MMRILEKMLGRFKESPEPTINYSENTQIWQARINNCKSTEELAELFQEFQNKLNTVSNYVVLLALIGNKFHQLGVTLRVTDRGLFMEKPRNVIFADRKNIPIGEWEAEIIADGLNHVVSCLREEGLINAENMAYDVQNQYDTARLIAKKLQEAFPNSEELTIMK